MSSMQAQVREKRARKAKATDPEQTNMEEKEGKRMVDVHHLGAEKSGATRPSQARPEARLWLRDHLGRQAWSAEEVKGAGGRTDRRENHRRAKKNGEEDPRGTSRDEGLSTSVYVTAYVRLSDMATARKAKHINCRLTPQKQHDLIPLLTRNGKSIEWSGNNQQRTIQIALPHWGYNRNGSSTLGEDYQYQQS
ncbi:hypothetical protein APICC_04879 [Apis cerana cerana]|uniref:Uncharacterized protein n=1 Tax=Apis cerana cerana TaxID=94128 RepID=A0A2A3EHD5_APICC|nr:hypothetical protein APICC_04879 [Apis cerana cerana]